jgi:general secretion pathway protein D
MNRKILYILVLITIYFTSCNTKNTTIDTKEKETIKDSVYEKGKPISSKNLPTDTIESNTVKELEIKHKIKLSQKEIDILFNKTKSKEERKNINLPFYDYFLKRNKSSQKINHVTITLNAAPIEEVVPIFAQLLNFNFYIDPKIKGIVSMSIDSDIDQKALWEIFQQVLWLTGSYASLDNKIVHILPFDKMAKERNIYSKQKSNVAVILFRLKNIKSKSIIDQLKPFITDGAVIMDIESQNSILVVDAPHNINKLKKIVKLLDKKYKISWPKTVIKCYNIPPTKIAKELAKIMPILGFPVTHIEKKNKSEEPGTINIEGLDRIGLLVASAANNEALIRLKKWVNILDQRNIGEQDQVFVYNVRNSKAVQLIQALSVIFNVQGKTLKAKKKTIQNSSSGSSSTFGGGSSSGFGTGGSSNTGENNNSPFGTVATAYELNSFNSRNSNQNNSANNDNSSISNNKNTSKNKHPISLFDVPTKIFADGANERLIIRTTPRVYSMIKALLERIDTIPEQVLVKLVVADVELTALTQFGLQIQGGIRVQGATYNWGTDYGYMDPTTLAPLSKDSFNFFQYGSKDIPGTATIQGFIKALQKNTKVKILAKPELLTQNHSNAMITVNTTVPIQTTAVNTSGGIIPDAHTDTVDNTSAYDYKDIGLILKLTPHITRGGVISIQMDHLLSTADGGISEFLPDIRQRRITSTFNVPNKGMIVVGGLIRNSKEEKLSTIPFLGNIPILNRLFGDTDVTKKRTELILIISAEIIKKTSNLEQVLVRYKQAAKLLTNAYSKEILDNNIVLEPTNRNKLILK